MQTADITRHDEVARLSPVTARYVTGLDLAYVTTAGKHGLTVLATDMDHAEQRATERGLGEIVDGQLVHSGGVYRSFEEAVNACSEALGNGGSDAA